MDLEEWEYLAEDGFIDQRVIPRDNQSLHPNSLIDKDYFHKLSNIHPKSPNLVIPLPIQFHEPPKESSVQLLEQESVSSQVFFKKLKGNEFVDMKLDSPKSTNRGLAPQIDLGNPLFQQKDEDVLLEDDGKKIPSKDVFDCDENDENHDGFNIWKMGMTGIGALFSFGFACATICVIVLTTRHKENKQREQKLHFHVYTDDEKRMKQVVHHATKLNEAISTIRGASQGRARVNLGGYFDGL